MKKPKRLFPKRRPIDHGKLFRRAMADVEAERSAARARMTAAIGPVPPQVEQLRRAMAAIDPQGSYSMVMPDGQVVTSTGRELLATAGLFTAIADAHEAGDEAALRRAALAFLAAT